MAAAAANPLQPGVYACVIVTFALALTTLALRFYARRSKNVQLWWDDWFALLSFSGCVLYDISVFFLITKGLGLHLDDLPVPVEEARYYQRMVQEIEEHAYTIAIGAAQLSLLALYWRLFQAFARARQVILLLLLLVSTWFLVRLLVAVFQCFPPRFFWDKSIYGDCTVNPKQFFLWSVSTHLAIDLALIILPATQISRLSLPMIQKAAILGMFMFGFMVMIASIMMLVVSSSYDSYADDTMWNCTPIVVWSAAEVHLSVMTCCLPILRPIVVAFGGWWSHNFRSRGSETSRCTEDSAKRCRPSRSSVGKNNRPASTESACQLATIEPANETTYIYGQGSGPDTIVEGTRRSDDAQLEYRTGTGPGIKVKYEVTMNYTE
ncbi:hypothetical protein V2A60_004137 [Cordyceps javanica]|uniref:Integral membrane protein n=1 Tax=Cordyceps javanica TaxID=43265 RepID=A0A545UW61_9HYPO|nr:integral membrane protein [Cordyceps javanica]TQW02293.1 integral membrane protein [Cordyceps javanica]